MALRFVSIGSAQNVHVYDDAGLTEYGVETDGKIRVGTAPAVNDEVVRLQDIVGPGLGVSAAAVITDHAAVRGDGGARGVQDSLVIISDTGGITIPNGLTIGSVGVPAAVTIEADGDILLSNRLGIGITPAYELHIQAPGDATSTIVVVDSTTPCSVFLQAADTIGRTGSVTNHDFRIQSNSTDRIYVDSDGRVGMGISPTAQLHVGTGATAAGQGQFKLESSTLLTIPEAGVMEYYDHVFYLTEVAHRRSITLADDIIVASTIVANSNTEDTLFTGTVAVDEAHPGKLYHVHAMGEFGTHDAADRITLRVYYGTVLIITLQSTAGAVTAKPWHMDTAITIRTAGAGGTLSAHGYVMLNMVEKHTNTDTTAVDTTAVGTITITAQWDSADVANTIQIDQGWIDVLG